jgi:GNAT superfamily N-acetyltransferase
MPLSVQEWRHDAFLLSTDPSKLQLPIIHAFLASSYWAPSIPLSIVEKCIVNSLCFGLYHRDSQVGFARVISDFATFAYLADVFVLPDFRGKGLSKFMMKCIKEHPELQSLRRWSLATADAHGLYAQFGFTPLKRPERSMEITDPDVYLRMSGKATG